MGSSAGLSVRNKVRDEAGERHREPLGQAERTDVVLSGGLEPVEERWEGGRSRQPDSSGGRASLPPLPCIPKAAIHTAPTGLQKLKLGTARRDGTPSPPGVMCCEAWSAPAFVLLHFSFLIWKMGAALIPASPSSRSESVCSEQR